MDIVPAVERWGAFGICLAVVMAFIGRKVWPFFSDLIKDQVNRGWKQVDDAKVELRESQERFLRALETRDRQLLDALERQSQAMDRIANQRTKR